jgi:hypothetical protein
MKDHFEEEPIDPRLKEYLKLLQMIPPRDPRAAARTQAKFLSELERVTATGAEEMSALSSLRAETSTSLPRKKFSVGSIQRTAIAFITVILLGFVFVFGGFGITARAAQSALPGDALYLVKTRIEQARLSLARDLSKEAELNMEFASTRLAEIGRLIEAGRFEESVRLSTEFNAYIQKALQVVGELAKVDPVRAGELNVEITSKLLEYTQKLRAMLAGLPESYADQIKNNIPAPELAPPSQENENTNSNENANANENVNSNMNDDDANEDDDDSVENNDNGNTNENGDENDNGDDEDDDGGNGNDNDDVGDDDDDNGNGSNDNDHDGDNDNDHDDDNDNESGSGNENEPNSND